MTDIYRQQVPFPRAWRSADLAAGAEDFVTAFSVAELAAMEEALEVAKGKGLTLDDLERGDFEQEPISQLMTRVAAELRDGKGIVLLRGFPLERYSIDEIGMIYWGLGCHLGIGVSQSVMGDRLGHVIDVSGKDPNQRAYRNSLELTLHTDTSDIISLLSLKKSARGGESLFASALAVHNEMLEKHPDLLAVLYEGFHYHRFGEEGPGQEPITPYRVPHFSCVEGAVSLRYVREYLELAADESGKPLNKQELAALDTFDAIARREDIKVEFTLQPGEAIFVNNLTVMHARRAFWDGEDPEQKRHLLRLWLNDPAAQPKVPEIDLHLGTRGGIAKKDGGSTYYTGKGKQPALEKLNAEVDT